MFLLLCAGVGVATKKVLGQSLGIMIECNYTNRGVHIYHFLMNTVRVKVLRLLD